MSTNPFDDPDGRFVVVVNALGQHSLWPAAMDVPAGWDRVFGEDGRESCLEYVRSAWRDIRPTV
jgi:MbtH protein